MRWPNLQTNEENWQTNESAKQRSNQLKGQTSKTNIKSAKRVSKDRVSKPKVISVKGGSNQRPDDKTNRKWFVLASSNVATMSLADWKKVMKLRRL